MSGPIEAMCRETFQTGWSYECQPCPLPATHEEGGHWHNHAGATFACTNTKRKWCRKQHIDIAHPCHLPHVPASSQVKTADNPAPIVLPTVDEVVDIIKEGGFYSDTARAVLGLIAARLPVWQPVEPGTVIKAGTRVRRPYLTDSDAVEHILPTDTPANDGWCIDPRTVPAEPEDPRVAVVAKAMSDALDDNGLTTCDWTAEARDILAKLDGLDR